MNQSDDPKGQKRKLSEDAASSPFPPPFTTKTLKQRLRKGIMLQSGGQKGSLTRCVQKYALLTSPSSTSVSTNRHEFLQELKLYQMDLTRSVLLRNNLEREIRENQALEESLAKDIEETKMKVQECQRKAKRAKQVQSSFKEYEALAKLALESSAPSTRQLRKAISKAKREIGSHQKEEAKLDEVLKVRKSQFHVLIQCMLDLKRSLNGDDAEDEQEGNGKDNGNNAQAMQVDGENENEEEGAIADDNLYDDIS